jgi:hypothetical protein
MKRNFLFISLTILSYILFSCGGSGKSGSPEAVAKKTNDLQAEKLNGEVKSVRQRVYWSLEKFGRIEKGKLQNMQAQDFLKVYDTDGFLIEETHFDSQDAEVTHKVISYNGKNQPLKEESNVAGKASAIVFTYENGLLQQKEISDEKGQMKERFAYSYDENNLVMDEDRYNEKDQLTQKIVNIYQRNKLVEKQYYWGGGTPYKRERFDYDEKGNIASIYTDKYEKKEPVADGHVEFLGYNSFNDYLTKNVYNKNDEKIEINDNSYDSQGNLTNRSTRKMKKEIIEYPEIIETTSTVDGEDIDDYIMEESGVVTDNIIREEIVNWLLQSGEAYEYTYDRHNNWTRKITYKINEKEEKVRQFYYEREIEYR